MDERISKCEKPITDVIERNKVPLFSNHLVLKNKKISKVTDAKMENKLTNKLLLSLLGRPEAEIDEFFVYESRKCPPTLADDYGRMRTGGESEIIPCLMNHLKKIKENSPGVFQNEDDLEFQNEEMTAVISTENTEQIPENESNDENHVEQNEMFSVDLGLNPLNDNEFNESENELTHSDSEADVPPDADDIMNVLPLVTPDDDFLSENPVLHDQENSNGVTAVFIDGPAVV